MQERESESVRSVGPAAVPEVASALPVALPVARVLALQQTAGNAAVARLLARQPAAAGAPPAVDAGEAERKADAVFAALDGWDDEGAAIAALTGNPPAMRRAIETAFHSRHGRYIQEFLKDNLSGDWLVKAFALLHNESLQGPHVALALALIPAGTRDADLFRTLEGATLAGRQEMERQYDFTFAEIGLGTLQRDLTDDLSGWALQKSLTLLHRDLSQAEHLYFNSVAIAGTHTESVVSAIQSAWRRGPEEFAQMERDWVAHVQGNNLGGDVWTTMDLRTAMRDELSGEDLELVEAVFSGADDLRGRREARARDELEGHPTAADPSAFTDEEQARMVTANRTVEAATTGGYTGAGTNEQQLYDAISTIREIWAARIDRTQQRAPERVESIRAAWNARRDELRQVVNAEMDAGGEENAKARLLLAGSLTPADELWLAGREFDTGKAVDVATRAWQGGNMNRLIEQARTERRDDAGAVLRPSFEPWRTVPVTSGLPFQRLIVLLNDRTDAQRGADRLRVEIDDGGSETQLTAAYTFLNDAQPALRAAAVAAYAADRCPPASGHSSEQAFVDHLEARYSGSMHVWMFADLLTPTSDPREMARRAGGRDRASHTGVGAAVTDAGVWVYDVATAEDTAEVTQESLQRLNFLATQAGAHPNEVEAIGRMLGKQPAELAQFEYDQFRARLDELRALRQSVADAISTTIEIVVDVAVTVATGGAAGAALLVSLSTRVAGMLSHEALLGDDYELFSRENGAALAAAVAEGAMGQLGGGLFRDIAGAERLEALGRWGTFMEDAARQASGQVGDAIARQAFDSRLPTAEDIAARALTIVGSSLGAGTTGALGHGLSADGVAAAARLRGRLIAGASGDLITSVTSSAATIAREGMHDQTGLALVAGWSRSAAGAATRCVVDGYKNSAAEAVAERRAGGGAQAEPEPHPRAAPHDEHTATGTQDEHGRTATPDEHGRTATPDEHGRTATPDEHGRTATPDEHAGTAPATHREGDVHESPDASGTTPPRRLTHADLLELFTRAFRRPGPPAEAYVLHGSDEEFLAAYLAAGGRPGTRPRGFYDPATGQFHLPPDASTLTALHEALHWSRTNFGAREILGAFWEEGLTEWLVQRAFGPRSTAYRENIRLCDELEGIVGAQVLQDAYLHGRWRPLRAALEAHFGSAAQAQAFYQALHGLDSTGQPPEALARALALLRRGSQPEEEVTQPDLRVPAHGPAEDPHAGQSDAQRAVARGRATLDELEGRYEDVLANREDLVDAIDNMRDAARDAVDRDDAELAGRVARAAEELRTLLARAADARQAVAEASLPPQGADALAGLSGRDAPQTRAQTDAQPGRVVGGERLQNAGAGWLSGESMRIAPIPGQVAAQLRAQGAFPNWRAFREALWRAVAADATLSSGFSPENQARMAQGRAPFAISSEHGRGRTYQLSHAEAVRHGGAVFDLDNIEIATPAAHSHVEQADED